MSGYMSSMSEEDAVRKCLLPISDNVTSRDWMSRDLSVYSNSEYVYAIYPIAVDLVWGQWGREIAKSESLSTIFAILTHCLNTTDNNNYFVRAQGQWFCLGAMLKWSFPCVLWVISRNTRMGLIPAPRRRPSPSLFTDLCSH